MEENIFDIRFEHEGKQHYGWVNPSGRLDKEGHPASFHVVLDGIHFGYLSFHNCRWSANEERPAGLVIAAGREIEKFYSL